jgi:hypothetical protein
LTPASPNEEDKEDMTIIRKGKILGSVRVTLGGSRNFSTSAKYWEDRYRRGGKSGAGSYNRLAVFKADVLNEFVASNDIDSVIEFGSGDGAQLDLAVYPDYTGVDVSTTILDETRRKFADHESMRFLHTSEVTPTDQADLSLSLDTIYHLVEDAVFETYMKQLFDAAKRYVIIYSSNEDKGWPDPHVRHRNFTAWVEANRSQFKLVRTISNPYPYSKDDVDNTSFADFYIFEKSSNCAAVVGESTVTG